MPNQGREFGKTNTLVAVESAPSAEELYNTAVGIASNICNRYRELATAFVATEANASRTVAGGVRGYLEGFVIAQLWEVYRRTVVDETSEAFINEVTRTVRQAFDQIQATSTTTIKESKEIQ